jgi:beta-carotene 3-hydroxylase
MGKEQGECFGMLIVPWKYLRQELKKQMLKFDFK